MAVWNPWHGCHKLSEGCRNCYVYRTDSRFGKDSSIVQQTSDFALPMRRNRARQYVLPPGEQVFACLTSDFFVPDADAWRPALWEMIRQRDDLSFFIITKRIDRFSIGLPADWSEGYPNVTIGCTVENQDRADYRLPLFLEAPIRHKVIICEPLLEALRLAPYLTSEIEQVVAGGESGNTARICKYDWVLSLRAQCDEASVSFYFKQTGARFVKDGKLYQIPRKLQHAQARKAGINTERKERNKT